MPRTGNAYTFAHREQREPRPTARHRQRRSNAAVFVIDYMDSGSARSTDNFEALNLSSGQLGGIRFRLGAS